MHDSVGRPTGTALARVAGLRDAGTSQRATDGTGEGTGRPVDDG